MVSQRWNFKSRDRDETVEDWIERRDKEEKENKPYREIEDTLCLENVRATSYKTNRRVHMPTP